MAYRAQIRTWLDLEKPDEAALNDYIGSLKKRRLWASTIKNALRLIEDLQASRCDVLLELFPHIGDKLASRAGGGGNDERLERIEKAILAASSGNDTSRHLSPVNGPKPLIPRPVPMLADDDDMPELTVKAVKGNGKISASNFLDSAFGLQAALS